MPVDENDGVQNIWEQPAQPPPPLFLGEKERDLVKQVNDELIERIIGQQVLYYPISEKHTDYHPIYGEAIEKNFLAPVRVYALVLWEGSNTTTSNFGIDRLSSIEIHFHKRRLTEDQDLFVREGDFVLYGDVYYEIVTLGQPRELFGQPDFKVEIVAKCIRAREGLFKQESDRVQDPRKKLASPPAFTKLVPADPVPSDPTLCIPKLSAAVSGSADFNDVVTLANNAANYHGCMFYLSATGSTIITPFFQAQKWYFNENGVWFPSPFAGE
tara:strand:+ start:1274 stop:2083 length:810 start_codon:yes stop_codon:yes gene_type:complete